MKYGSTRCSNDGTHEEKSPPLPSLAEAIRFAVAMGDGRYYSGKVCSYGGYEIEVSFTVAGGQIQIPERSDWDRVMHGSHVVSLIGTPIPSQRTAYIIKPGQLSREGLYREPGTCIAREIRCGDKLIDVLTLRDYSENVEVYSERQMESWDYDWTDDGPGNFDRTRKKWTAVSIAGRAGAWGSIGDDSYDPGSADEIIADIVMEIMLGLKDWKIAPIYYETQEVEVDDERRSRHDPILRVDMNQRFRIDQYQPWIFARLVAASKSEDRRPLDLIS